jgi:hypothetical protein
MRQVTRADRRRAARLSDESVECLARLLWKERDGYFVKIAPSAPSLSWEEAPDEGRELLRQAVRAGKTSWLDETPEEAKDRLAQKAREEERAKNPREFAKLFRDEFPDRADRLSLCIEQYLKRWFDEWFAGVGELMKDPANRQKGWSKMPKPARPLDGDRWVRDVMLVVLVFRTEHKFQTPREKSCEIVTDAARLEGLPPLMPLEVEALALEHAALLDQLREIAAT